ncbi:MAG: hypothetical protein A2X03_11280 [Bacteroidetes bacterium GWA2_40_15]|nr:MAG: hypothetical protein A2X03_11280 [Bacteroidetes bacterium GWA2_40_15]OFX84047.1 MAG: hypothetical protein A2X06_14385 [Bacteroidetes bacterium GWC2_40_22]HBH84175.1 hypothetical protein [Bacteroidales bacterium]
MEADKVKLKEIKPVLTGYISKSQILLKRDAVPDEDAVHDIRVLMKKSRAVLKLTCPLTDTELQNKDIHDLKRVGQLMSILRDTSVHRKTLRDLRKEFPGIFKSLAGNEKIGKLMQKPEDISEPDLTMNSEIDEINELINKSGYRIRFYQIQNIDPVKLMHQLELSFYVVQNIYLECRNKPIPEKIHQFRKRSKDFLYQLYFFRPLNPAAVKALEKRLERMTMYLGAYNDLYQLIKSIGYTWSGESADPAMDELILKIRDKQDESLARVWPVAYKCFCPGKQIVNLLGFKLLVL